MNISTHADISNNGWFGGHLKKKKNPWFKTNFLGGSKKLDGGGETIAFFLKIVSSQANIRNTFLDQKSPRHQKWVFFLGWGSKTARFNNLGEKTNALFYCVIAGQYKEYVLRPEVSPTPGSGCFVMAQTHRHRHRHTHGHRPEGQFSENSNFGCVGPFFQNLAFTNLSIYLTLEPNASVVVSEPGSKQK